MPEVAKPAFVAQATVELGYREGHVLRYVAHAHLNRSVLPHGGHS